MSSAARARLVEGLVRHVLRPVASASPAAAGLAAPGKGA
jgi:hypothetical protein